MTQEEFQKFGKRAKLHPRGDIERLYISRRRQGMLSGGKSMISVEATYYRAEEGICRNLELKEQDKDLGMVYRIQQETSPKH